jgi:lysozyme family protein
VVSQAQQLRGELQFLQSTLWKDSRSAQVVIVSVAGGTKAMDVDGRLRRRLLQSTATLVGGALAAPALAQARDPISAILNVLGLLKPPPAPARAPGKTVDVVGIATALTLLENEATRLGLRPSRLSLEAAADPAGPPPATADDLYTSGMPRLVSVIERAETTNVELSDRAGDLLAEINATQHSIPEVFDEKRTPSRARDYAELKPEYTRFFASAALRPERSDLANWHAAALRQFRRRYESVTRATGVPWFFIGVVHGLEASYNFRAHLHNGDAPLSQRTRQVPAGRPKAWTAPYDWEASAVDALKLMGFAGAEDWSLERTLYRLEAYNGFGYRKLGVPTPYLWSFTNHYEAGKFVADGSFNPRAKSQQCGAATTLKLLTDAGDVLWS